METNFKNKKAISIAIIVVVIAMILYEIIPIPETEDGYLHIILADGLLAFLALLAACVTKKLGLLKPDTKGFVSGNVAGAYLWFVILIRIFMWLVNLVLGKTEINLPISSLIFFVIGYLLVGLAEELLFRGIILDGFLDYFGTSSTNTLRKAIIISGILFGVTHFTNLIHGMDTVYVIVQVFSNVLNGILYGIMFVRGSRNIYPAILCHACWDMSVGISQGELAAKAATSVGNASSSGSNFVLMAAISIVIVSILAWYEMKDEKLLPYVDTTSEQSK